MKKGDSLAKSEFDKVEKILEQGLLKISVEHLLQLADLAAGLGKAEVTQKAVETSNQLFLAAFKSSLLWLERRDKNLYKRSESHEKS